ncbi:MAG: hypothetical protein ACFFBP_09045 [Promethearchaeota archaeon]
MPPQPLEMFVGMIIEIVVMIIAIVILYKIYQKYLQKRHRFTILLFYIFTCFLITIFLTWFSKLIQLFWGLDYVNPNIGPDPMTLESFFILRIVEYRFTFAIFTVGVALTYILRVNLFDDNYKFKEKIFIYSFGAFSIFFDIFIYIKDIEILGVIAYILLLFYVLIIYVPFTLRCIESYKGVKEQVYKKGFLSLIIMSIAVCSILIFNMIDVIYIVRTDTSFTIFYYIHLASIIIGYLGAYYGYIIPRTST